MCIRDRRANKEAGVAINRAAQNLKGQAIDVTPVGDDFVSNLADMGITVRDGQLDFRGSDIEGLKGPENAIKNIFNRMTGPKVPDAYEAHRLKRFIDEQVSYGKNAEGLAGQAERSLKQLRSNLDNLLDENFPAYNQANTAYSETINALDELQSVAGRKIDLTADNANKAVGTLMRRLMGNAQSRVKLLDAIDTIEPLALRYAGRGQKLIGEAPQQDLTTLVLFADELDNVFGPAARTSLQGEFDAVINRAIQQGVPSVQDLAVEGLKKGAEIARGINKEGALKSIKELLK